MPGRSPHPPCPLHSLFPPHDESAMLAQVPCPAHALSLLRPRFLQEFNPRHVCGSSMISFSASESVSVAAGKVPVLVESLTAGGLPPVQPSVVPATSPLNAATVNLWKSRRSNPLSGIKVPFIWRAANRLLLTSFPYSVALDRRCEVYGLSNTLRSIRSTPKSIGWHTLDAT